MDLDKKIDALRSAHRCIKLLKEDRARLQREVDTFCGGASALKAGLTKLEQVEADYDQRQKEGRTTGSEYVAASIAIRRCKGKLDQLIDSGVCKAEQRERELEVQDGALKRLDEKYSEAMRELGKRLEERLAERRPEGDATGEDDMAAKKKAKKKAAKKRATKRIAKKSTAKKATKKKRAKRSA